MAEETQSLALWEEDIEPAERARRMIATKKLISGLSSERDRRDYDLFNLRLYSKNNDLLLYDLFSENFVGEGRAAVPPTENSKNNRAKAAIDTLASQVASTDTRGRFEVVNGDYRVRRRARQLQDFSDGIADDLKLSEVKRRMFMDSAVFESGVGIAQLYRNGSRCAVQRVLPTELAIDPSDGFVDGVPRTIHRERPVPRANVLAGFGDTEAKRTAIEAARAIPTGGTPIDQILVFESWTLPTSPGAGDGWHIVAVDVADGDLVVEEYEKDFHELVFFSIEERFTGVWGNSLMTQARDLQIRINANDYRVEKSTKVFHAQHLYANRQAGMKKATWSNELGTVWEGNGDVPPQQIKFTCASPELYTQIERDGQRIFEDLGVNLSSSNGQSDLGLDSSGAALREETVKLDRRNSLRQQRYEDLHLALLRVAISIVRDIVNDPEEEEDDEPKKGSKRKAKAKPEVSYTVDAKTKNGLSRLDFNKVAIDEENYKLTVKPASPVPTDPAGLQAYGQQQLDIGLWEPEDLAEYMQDLDASGRTNNLVSKKRNFDRKFDEALYEGAPLMPPDEFTDYKMAMKLGLQWLNQAEEDGVPQKDIEKLRRYLRQVNRLNSAAAPAAPAAPAPGGNVATPPPAEPPAP